MGTDAAVKAGCAHPDIVLLGPTSGSQSQPSPDQILIKIFRRYIQNRISHITPSVAAPSRS